MMRSYRASTRKGFTLIELLVVISIIALLISILLPSLGRARIAANAALDAANQQQIGRGIHLYAADFNNFAPLHGGWTGNLDVPGANCAGTGVYTWQGNGNPSAAAATAQQGILPQGIGVLGTIGGKADNAATTAPLNGLYSIYSDGSAGQENIARSWHPSGGGIRFTGYIDTWDVYFNPNDRNATRVSSGADVSSFWALRDFIGTAIFFGAWNPNDPTLTVHPATGSAIHRWGVPAGTNYDFQSSYSYRGADSAFYDPDVNATAVLSPARLDAGLAGTGPGIGWNITTTGGRANNNNYRNARTDSLSWGGKAIMMNTSFRHVDPTRDSVNITRGDGSVNRLNDTQFFTLHSTVNEWFPWNAIHSRRFALANYSQGW